jgi:hypothetical protein
MDEKCIAGLTQLTLKIFDGAGDQSTWHGTHPDHALHEYRQC